MVGHGGRDEEGEGKGGGRERAGLALRPQGNRGPRDSIYGEEETRGCSLTSLRLSFSLSEQGHEGARKGGGEDKGMRVKLWMKGGRFREKSKNRSKRRMKSRETVLMKIKLK